MLHNLPVRDPEQLVTFGNSNGAGVAGGIDIGGYGLYPWYFARQLQAAPGPFQGIASYCSFADKVSIRLPGADGLLLQFSGDYCSGQSRFRKLFQRSRRAAHDGTRDQSVGRRDTRNRRGRCAEPSFLAAIAFF